MAEAPDPEVESAASSQEVILYRNRQLGQGSYGVVCKAKYGLLPCAAKLLHPIFFRSDDPGCDRMVQRFERECEFLSGLRHPNIVQYLGMYRDLESGLPVLLMELMEQSLTRFLESSILPLLLCIQVDLCEDVALALTYLHSQGIIHRDLSSNNVLLIGNKRAKLTDFGMSKLMDSQVHFTPLTQCPGCPVFMPPEALLLPPKYSKELDSFSFGVIGVQVITRHFPNPSQAMSIVEDARSPTGVIQIPVSEIERRKNDLEAVSHTHPLKPLLLRCLNDNSSKRPSAKELCDKLAELKETACYNTSRQEDQDVLQARERHIRELQDQLYEKTQLIRSKEQENRDLRTHMTKLLQSGETNLRESQSSELGELSQTLVSSRPPHRRSQSAPPLCNSSGQILSASYNPPSRSTCLRYSESKSVPAADRYSIDEVGDRAGQLSLQEGVFQSDTSELQKPAEEEAPQATGFQLTWKSCQDYPGTLVRGAAAMDGHIAYVSSCDSFIIYSYNTQEDDWHRVSPDCPTTNFGLAVIEDVVTTVGGNHKENLNSFLFSLDQRNWVQKFPPMPTACAYCAVVLSGKYLIVAGGSSGKDVMQRASNRVYVLNTELKQWSYACTLPSRVLSMTATVCGDKLYLLGGEGFWGSSQSVFTCSLTALLKSCVTTLPSSLLSLFTNTTSVWESLTDTPLLLASCSTIGGKLLAFGGREGWVFAPRSLVYMHEPQSGEWKAIGDMPTARFWSIAVPLPGNRVMVLGGRSGLADSVKAVEVAELRL